MSTTKLKAAVRKTGKHNSRALRSSKMIPAVIYGPKNENLNISIDEVSAVKYFSDSQYDNIIFTIESEDKEINSIQILKKDFARHPVSRRPVHIDFYAPDMTKTVKVNVELRFVGKSVGVTEGGLLQEIKRDIEIECLPTEIAEFFEVDVTELKMGETMHVSNVLTSESYKIITPSEESIVSIIEPKAEEEVVAAPAADAAAAPAADGAAPAADAAPATDKK